MITPELAIPVSSVFARHETFHPRFGWLKKGLDAAIDDPKVFLEDDATIRLGVGKNMVKSIRYWCNAFKLLENDCPTILGKQLLGDGGWDPFCEDTATLWLLHWNLFKPSCQAAAWYFTFNLYRANEFSQNDLYLALCDYRDSLGSPVAESSLYKDINCILRMYVKQSQKSQKFQLNEDNLSCPFAELGLIHVTDNRHYMFRFGKKRSLPDEIVVACCLEYIYCSRHEQKTISISRLLYDPGSPGMIFKLTESAICNAIEEMSKTVTSISLSDTAGLIQFAFTSDPIHLSQDILLRYYQSRKIKVA